MRIVSIDADLHVFGDVVNWDEPIRLSIRFDDGMHLRLGVGGDGAQLALDRMSLEGPIDMAEYGRVEIRDLTDHLDPGLRHAEVGIPLAVHGPHQCLVGIVLPRPESDSFCLWVSGDRLLWGAMAELLCHDWPENFAIEVGGTVAV